MGGGPDPDAGRAGGMVAAEVRRRWSLQGCDGRPAGDPDRHDDAGAGHCAAGP